MIARLVPFFPAIALVVVLATIALFCLAVWLESMALTNPPGYRQPDPRAFTYTRTPRSELGLEFEDISFAAPSQEVIRAWLVPAPEDAKRVAAVLVHGRGGDRAAVMGFMPLLHELGAGVVAIDLRENGLSAGSGRGTTIGMREAEDVAAAAAEMRRRGYERVVLIGCSLGASASILAAARDASIDGVFADSPIAYFDRFVAEIADKRLAKFGVSAPWATAIWGRAVLALTRARLGLNDYEASADAVGRIAPRPVLLAYGAQDDVTAPATHGQALAAQAGEGASLWVVEGAGHCEAPFASPDAYRARILALLDGG
ncbi:MAG TPA: alpha/beta fold hydrolase [Terricaulis sp.]|nr:alpha/beta fold hydrolase [Terricaulis sp.]